MVKVNIRYKHFNQIRDLMRQGDAERNWDDLTAYIASEGVVIEWDFKDEKGSPRNPLERADYDELEMQEWWEVIDAINHAIAHRQENLPK